MSPPGEALWTVVVAEDDVPLRALLRFSLQRDPRFSVVGEASDGVEAMRLLSEQDPDLLLLDLAMPRMDGLEVLQKLSGRDRPVVAVLTGLDDDDLEDQARTAGAASYLTKGSAFDVLTEHLAQLLR